MKKVFLSMIVVAIISAVSICNAGWWYDATHSDRGNDSEWVTCWDCGGSGDCSDCNGTGICSVCDGKDKHCRYCFGDGDCPKCNGSGRCADCGGSGGEWQ